MVFEAICLIPVIGGSIYAILCLISVMRFKASSGASSGSRPASWPPVTILKPVCGLEKNLRENLRSACVQDYPEYQVVFSVQVPNDAALPLLKDLQREYGADKVSIAVDGSQTAPNGKVRNLLGGLPYARYDLLVISDSDVMLGPDYLKTIVAPLEDPAIGYVCTLYKASHAETWFEIWGDWPETLEELRRHVEAVASGRFEEWTRGRRSLGVFHFASGDIKYRQNLIGRPLLLQRWTHRPYERY